MHKWFRRSAGILLAVLLLLPVIFPASAAAADQTTKYRLYEANRIVKEYASLDKAIEDGKKLMNAHVETIGNRTWVWDNLAKYRVYQQDKTLPHWQFSDLQKAINTAKYYSNSSVREIKTGQWVWNNYELAPKLRYKLQQGDNFLPNWLFEDLESAQKEARKWSNSHIIDLHKNTWVWDRVTPERKEELRSGEAVYTIYVDGQTQDDWSFGYLGDAVAVAEKLDNSVIRNTKKNIEVYSNRKPYTVYQRDNALDRFVTLEEALKYARKWSNASIQWNGREVWNNSPYYRVYQNDKLIGQYFEFPNALKFANGYANASIATRHGEVLWDNANKLMFWSWTGEARPDTIRSQVAGTMGLDVVSPTWFILQDASGTIKDTSDKATADWLKQQHYTIYPLVHNQFDSKLTSAFLKDAKARKKFIESLVAKCVELGVHGFNIDFESLAGSDRDAFTSFVRDLTAAAHAESLVVSIDLPRGSISWNHLSAFDHEKLKDIVDYIITMAYDQHWSSGSSAGSVAGLQWTEQGIVEFLSYGIPRSKLILGIPFYSREWRIDKNGKLLGNRALTMREIPPLLASKQVVKSWDERFNQYKISYEEDGVTRVFWLEDESTIEARLKLAKKYDLAGVAAWRMGHEYPEIWETMLKNK